MSSKESYNRAFYPIFYGLTRFFCYFVGGLWLSGQIAVVEPVVALSPVVSHALPVCVRLELILEMNEVDRWFLLIGLNYPNNGSNDIMVLGQITKKAVSTLAAQQRQVTLPAGTYRLLLAAYNNEDVYSVSVKNIHAVDGECLDDGKLYIYIYIYIYIAWYALVDVLTMMTSSNGNISALLTLCEGNPPVTGGFPSQRQVTWSFGVFFDLRLNKRMSKE